MGGEPDGYTLYTVPDTEIIKEYADGGSLRQFTFVFASRNAYGADEAINTDNSTFYENFAAWLEECTNTKNLPDLGDGMHAQSICAKSLGYMFEGGADTARYQIQCKLIYYKES